MRTVKSWEKEEAEKYINEIPKILQSNRSTEEKRNAIKEVFNKVRQLINNASPPLADIDSSMAELDRIERGVLSNLSTQEVQEPTKNAHVPIAAHDANAKGMALMNYYKNLAEFKKTPTTDGATKTRESVNKLGSMAIVSQEIIDSLLLHLSYLESLYGFKANQDSSVPARQSGVASTPSSRRGGPSEGRVDLRAIDGEKHSVNFPVFVKLCGDMKSEINGSALWKVGNMMFGASHASADKLSYLKSGSQKETNFVATFMAGKAFGEIQFGTMSAENAYKANWSGTQQLAAVGYDFDSGITPFVEVAARQLTKDALDARNEVYGFAGVSVDVSATKNDFFNYDTLLTAKGGVKSFKSQNEVVSSLTLENSLNFNSGISFKTNMSLSSETDTSYKISVGFSQ